MSLDPNILHEVLLNRWVMLALILIYAGFSVTEIFRRHLLSKGAVFYVTMFLAPAAAYSSIAAPLWIAMTDNSDLEKVLYFIGGIVLFFLSAFVYIRGHIFPTEKNFDYGGQEKLIGARRLITVGALSALLYWIFSIIQLVVALNWVMMLGNGLMPILGTLALLLFGLLIPIANIFIIIYFIMLGTQFLIWAAILFMAFLQSLLVTNGCIRYILTEDRSKLQKALFILLALVPGVNIIMGIRYSVQISRIFKEQKERSLKYGENEGRI